MLQAFFSVPKTLVAWASTLPCRQQSSGLGNAAPLSQQHRATAPLAGRTHPYRRQAGFTIVELLVVLAVAAIMTGIAAPNLRSWMRIYQLKSASMDLFSNMQLARANAVRESRPWKIRFDQTNGKYELIRCLTRVATNCETGTLNTTYQIAKTVSFSYRYKNQVQYNRPASLPAIDFPSNPLVFNTDGSVGNNGYIYLSNNTNSSYYCVGFRSIASAARVQKLTGTGCS